MNLAQLREAAATSESAAAQAFEILSELAGLVARSTDEESSELNEAREIAIRMVEHREALGGAGAALDAMLRRLGLFPYLDTDALGVRDLMALEAHRPLDLPEEDIVFHRVQAEVYRMLMDGINVILSAPTSFGKSLVIDALVASGRYRNIVVVVPTIALIDETRRRLSRFAPGYKVVTHVTQPLAEKNLLVLTQERVLDLPELPDLDLFVIDEFYKLSPEREPAGGKDRAYLLNQAFGRLHRTGAQFYFLGPNIRELAATVPDEWRGKMTFVRTSVSTVALDEHRIDPGDDPAGALVELCRTLEDPTLIYCQSPRSAREVVGALVEGKVSATDSTLDRGVEWVSSTYHPDWSVSQGLSRGIGVHHGQMPRALAHFMVRAFKERRLRFLVCTSSLIEGVNTPAKNVIVFDKKIGRSNFDFFDFGNIRGRSGRMSVHHVGRVYLFHQPPEERLPEVDIPALSQPDDVPSSLLLGLSDDELTDRSRERLSELAATTTLPLDTMKENIGIVAERQIATATAIESDLAQSAALLTWHGPPTYDELKFACELIWDHLHEGRREAGVGSASQLAYRINRLRDSPTAAKLIAEEMATAFTIDRGLSVDEVVENVLGFLRSWATFNFPRYLMALDRLARHVLTARGVTAGDFSVFAAQVENLFLPQPLLALEEYGLPRSTSEALISELQPDGDLDATLGRLALIDSDTAPISSFEREMLVDVQASLPPISR